MRKLAAVLLGAIPVLLACSFLFGVSVGNTGERDLNSDDYIITAIEQLAIQTANSEHLEIRRVGMVLHITLASSIEGTLDHLVEVVIIFEDEEIERLNVLRDVAKKRLNAMEQEGTEQPEDVQKEVTEQPEFMET